MLIDTNLIINELWKTKNQDPRQEKLVTKDTQLEKNTTEARGSVVNRKNRLIFK